MAICSECGREMLTADSCSVQTVKFPDGFALPSVPHMGDERCHDCNVAPGGFHHPGCDMESCPRCGGQLISCGCLAEEDDD